MIRFAEQRDLPAIYSLWETCFPDEGGFNGYFFSHIYEPQHTLLLMQENTLCAMLQMLPSAALSNISEIYFAAEEDASVPPQSTRLRLCA